MVHTIYADNILQSRLSLSFDEFEKLMIHILYTQRSNKKEEYEKLKNIIKEVFNLNSKLQEAIQRRQHAIIKSIRETLKTLASDISGLDYSGEKYSLTQINSLKETLYEPFMENMKNCGIIIEVIDARRGEFVVEHEKFNFSALDDKELINSVLNLSNDDINIIKTIVTQNKDFIDVIGLAQKINQVLKSEFELDNVEFILKFQEDIKEYLKELIEKFRNKEDLSDLQQDLDQFKQPARFDVYFFKQFLKQDIVYRKQKMKYLKGIIENQFNITTPHVRDSLAKFLYNKFQYISEHNFLATYFEFVQLAEPHIMNDEQLEQPELTLPIYKKFKEIAQPYIVDNIIYRFLKINKKDLHEILCEYNLLKSSGNLTEETKKPFDNIFKKTLELVKQLNENKNDDVKRRELIDKWRKESNPEIDIDRKCENFDAEEQVLMDIRHDLYFPLYHYLSLPSIVHIIFDGDFLQLSILKEDKSIDIIVKSKPSKVFYRDDNNDFVINKNNEYYRTQLDPPNFVEYFKDIDSFDITLRDNFPETSYVGSKGYFAPELPGGIPTSTLDYKLDYPNHWGQRKLLLTEIDFLTQTLSSKDDKIDIIYAGSAHGTHIKILFDLFPNIRFHLYDPAIFDSILKPYVRSGQIIINEYYHDVKYKNNKIDRNTPFLKYGDRQKLPEDYGFFTDEVAEYYRQKFYDEKENYSKCLFISDIRRDLPKDPYKHKGKADWSWDFEKIVLEDQEFMRKWLQIMRPQSSMLKFKEPYVKDGRNALYKYFQGIIRLQIWHPPNSAETRLIVNHNDIDTEVFYDIIAYERKTSYYNYLRINNIGNMEIPFLENVKLIDIGKKVAPRIKYYNIDFYNEINLLNEYNKKFEKKDLDFRGVVSMMRSITAVIDRYKKNNPDNFTLKMKESDDF